MSFKAIGENEIVVKISEFTAIFESSFSEKTLKEPGIDESATGDSAIQEYLQEQEAKLEEEKQTIQHKQNSSQVVGTDPYVNSLQAG